MHAAYAIAPPHPHHPAIELTVRRAETQDCELETKYVYVLSDGTGAVRYAGSTGNLRRRETTHRHSYRRPDQSPLTRHLAALFSKPKKASDLLAKASDLSGRP